MIRFLSQSLLTLLLLCAAMMPAQAQAVSPWFRGSKQVWESLLKNSLTPAGGKAALSVPLSNAVTGLSVKTTAHNWLLYRMSHSGVFSRMEKDILLQKNASKKAILGKLAYFHDRDAQLFNTLSLQPEAKADEPAFWRHQNLLSNALAELETFYRAQLPNHLTHTLFTREHIKHLLADPLQPAAFVLNVKEMEFFASLNTLAEQRAWAAYAVRRTAEDLQMLLSREPKTLKGYEFERYYLQKIRLGYFQTLQEALSKSTQKRNSLILRRKRILKIDLPGAQQPMTDAQRLGFLKYHLDQLSQPELFDSHAENNFQKYMEVKTLLSRLAPLYETYAVAEAFNVPYEQTLRQGFLWPEIIVGKTEGEKLQALLGKTPLLPYLSPRISELNQKMAAMRRQSPTDLDFYVRYYRLEKEKSLYQTFLLRERLLRGL